MSALSACRVAAFPAGAPDSGAVAAADAGGTVQESSRTTGAGGADGSPRSFQQMMNESADAPEAARAGTNPATTAANASGTTAVNGTDPVVTPASPAPQPIASMDAVAAQVAAIISAGQPQAADSVLAALALAGPVPTNTSTTIDAPSADGARASGAAKPSASDADPATDDTLAAMLATLAQLGFVPQAVAAVPMAPTTDPAAASTVAVETELSVTGGAANPAAKLPATLPDQVLARLRPGLSADTAISTASPEAAANAATRLDATGGQIVLRDLLDGHGSDAAVARDPAETTVAGARAAEASVASATTGTGDTRSADAVTRTISIPVQHPRWADAVSSEVRWFAEQGVQNATLRLSPEHLGPVEVRVALADGQVNVNFSAANADTRAALEQSLPRLRDMLAGAGLSLGEAQVQQQTRQGSQNSFNSGGGPADTDVRDTLARVPMRLGLVDEYA